MSRLADHNGSLFSYWSEAAQIPPPNLNNPAAATYEMEQAAALLDAIFRQKQANLTEAIGAEAEAALSAWETGRGRVQDLNNQLSSQIGQVASLKASIDPSALSRLEQDLNVLQATKRRHEPEVARMVEELQQQKDRKSAISREKSALREELSEHGRAITQELGTSINAYLRRLNAGFRIDYREPDYRGKEPAASYHILINETPISPRGIDLDKPSFRNTLSAGDKSTLSLALFLARINTDPMLSRTIVVLDDPFASLDHFRRQFTASEIRNLCGRAAQTVVLSHDKSFLRLLWDKLTGARSHLLRCKQAPRGE